MSRTTLLVSAFLTGLLVCGLARAEYDGDPGLGHEDFTYQKMLDLLKAGQPSTLKDALNLFKRNHPDYFNYYTLVYQSFSLQKASFQSPRAIVFGRDAKLVMAFNGKRMGNAYPRGSDNLEVMHYDGKKRQFEFRLIAFRDEHHEPDDPYLSAAPYQISPPNSTLDKPGMCYVCHGNEPRPNWEAYSVWPGVYGSLDDFNDPNYRRMKESTEFKTFMGSISHRDRYSVLGKQSAPRPNHDFGILLTGLNTQRVINLLVKNPKVMARKFAILHALACDPPVAYRKIRDSASPYATERTIEVPAQPLTPLQKDVQKRIAENLASKLERVASLNGVPLQSLLSPYTSYGLAEAAKRYGLPKNRPALAYAYSFLGLKEALAVAELRKILDPIGLNIDDWTLPLGQQSFVFDEPSSNSINIPLRLIFARPFLKAAFSDPADRALHDRFERWIQVRDGTEAMPDAYDRDCKLLLTLDRRKNSSSDFGPAR